MRPYCRFNELCLFFVSAVFCFSEVRYYFRYLVCSVVNYSQKASRDYMFNASARASREGTMHYLIFSGFVLVVVAPTLPGGRGRITARPHVCVPAL